MRIILLSGGCGKRLWPLSTESRAKQFLPVLRGPGGLPESMIQRVYRQLCAAGIGDSLVVSTGEGQAEAVREHLGAAVEMVLEPERRNTFPAIALSAAYLRDRGGCGANDVAVAMPSDVYAEDAYFETLSRMAAAAADGAAELVLMGIAPTRPAAEYGYIVPQSAGGGLRAVQRFVEKPPSDVAARLIDEGALWNGGVFAFRLGWLLELVEKSVPVQSFDALRARYGELERASFDRAVVEKATSVAVMPYGGLWRDLGSPETLAEVADPAFAGL